MEAKSRIDGRLRRLAAPLAMMVPLLAVAACASESGTIHVEPGTNTCALIDVTHDESGALETAEVCGPSPADVPVPTGGQNVTVREDGVLTLQERVYIGPNETVTIATAASNEPEPAPAAEPTPAPAPATEPGEPATLDCLVHENGAYAPGSIDVRALGASVASGSCGTALTIDPGTYDVTIRLDEVLDRPSKTMRIVLSSGEDRDLVADFETAILEVRLVVADEPVSGLVEVLRTGQLVGTLGSSVPWRVSAGTYDVVAHYRTDVVRFDNVELAPAQRRALLAAFE